MTDTSEKIQELAKKITLLKHHKAQKYQHHTKPETLNALAIQPMIERVSGIIVGSSIGYILDEIFDFEGVCLLIFTILGGVAGFINVTRYIHQNKDNQEES